MNTLAAGISWIDLHFMGRPHAIATAVLQGPGAVALVDPGPTTCLEALENGLQAQGVALSDVTEILVTHIHLDHAGATGTILARHPRIRVLVHQRGAPHLIDPSRLLDSASRLYRDQMDHLWGEVAPVPAGQVVALDGGERLRAGGRELDVLYTPGHAVHHVCFRDRDSGVAFVGDTAGVAVDGGYLLPPTPPPDIDIEAWHASLHLLEQWGASALFLTHFATAPSVVPHLRTLAEHLDAFASEARRALEGEASDEDRAQRFAAGVRLLLQREMPASQVAAYEAAAPFELLWLGLARYWRKRPRA
ncbi:MAG: MBL fold metallo-hydrolase [Acidobacteria bacterium]|nr:MBL fold metallo-hydrolase [Acidobacteriota bacterium]